MPRISEEAFQRQVLDLACLYGFQAYHTHDSRHSARGWPDLVLCRPPVILFVELKAERTPITEEQAEWMAALTACGLETYLWRPSDWDALHERLRSGGRAARPPHPSAASTAVS